MPAHMAAGTPDQRLEPFLWGCLAAPRRAFRWVGPVQIKGRSAGLCPWQGLAHRLATRPCVCASHPAESPGRPAPDPVLRVVLGPLVGESSLLLGMVSHALCFPEQCSGQSPRPGVRSRWPHTTSICFLPPQRYGGSWLTPVETEGLFRATPRDWPALTRTRAGSGPTGSWSQSGHGVCGGSRQGDPWEARPGRSPTGVKGRAELSYWLLPRRGAGNMPWQGMGRWGDGAGDQQPASVSFQKPTWESPGGGRGCRLES